MSLSDKMIIADQLPSQLFKESILMTNPNLNHHQLCGNGVHEFLLGICLHCHYIESGRTPTKIMRFPDRKQGHYIAKGYNQAIDDIKELNKELI